MNVDEMLALLENGGYRTMKDGGTSSQSEAADTVELGMAHLSLAEPEEEGPNSDKSDACDSDTTSSDTSDSDSDSSSSSEGDSDSDTSSDEDEDSAQVNQQQGMWYQQWYQNVYHQRQLIQMNEYQRAEAVRLGQSGQQDPCGGHPGVLGEAREGQAREEGGGGEGGPARGGEGATVSGVEDD